MVISQRSSALRDSADLDVKHQPSIRRNRLKKTPHSNHRVLLSLGPVIRVIENNSIMHFITIVHNMCT
ncbi:hypothetical protein AX774_g4999 [Zancudomyces culisetae]|uniref:Uncharacterized protein n=2 Tax=Zancudomyces culisetae TaxID=1213189 RepID=A0A1R1PKT2_ZANCU|nr:hypothetical protein AX774_g4999 [Zancudomyces culisetae]|eukprot:OMH81549.1 hypothetical protein AX774_g4999 [Zancudomyces culisetae]